MNPLRVTTAAAIAVAVGVSAVLLFARPDGNVAPAEADEHSAAEPEFGPHGGRLLRDGDFALEVTIYENGLPPELRLYGYLDGEPVDPTELSASVELERLGGKRELIRFQPEQDYLRGEPPVREPHSFDVRVEAAVRGAAHRWSYEGYEGRTEISQRAADASGIAVERAGPATIVDAVELTGTIQTDPSRIARVRPRFGGIVTDVHRTIGDSVRAGEALASIETNESLRSVSVTAPIGGLIVDRSVQAGQVPGTEPLFVIADLSEVWAQLDVFGRHIDSVRAGQHALLRTLDGGEVSGEIDFISPLVAHGSQSVRARVTLPNPDNRLRPGQFVSARVIVDEIDVPLAVKRSALQRFRDFDVVFVKVGNVYEVRMLELGRMDGVHAEVLSGLEPGAEYVTENSYLIKADIEKAGASHDH